MPSSQIPLTSFYKGSTSARTKATTEKQHTRKRTHEDLAEVELDRPQKKGKSKENLSPSTSGDVIETPKTIHRSKRTVSEEYSETWLDQGAGLPTPTTVNIGRKYGKRARRRVSLGEDTDSDGGGRVESREAAPSTRRGGRRKPQPTPVNKVKHITRTLMTPPPTTQPNRRHLSLAAEHTRAPALTNARTASSPKITSTPTRHIKVLDALAPSSSPLASLSGTPKLTSSPKSRKEDGTTTPSKTILWGVVPSSQTQALGSDPFVHKVDTKEPRESTFKLPLLPLRERFASVGNKESSPRTLPIIPPSPYDDEPVASSQTQLLHITQTDGEIVPTSQSPEQELILTLTPRKIPRSPARLRFSPRKTIYASSGSVPTSHVGLDKDVTFSQLDASTSKLPSLTKVLLQNFDELTIPATDTSVTRDSFNLRTPSHARPSSVQSSPFRTQTKPRTPSSKGKSVRKGHNKLSHSRGSSISPTKRLPALFSEKFGEDSDNIDTVSESQVKDHDDSATEPESSQWNLPDLGSMTQPESSQWFASHREPVVPSPDLDKVHLSPKLGGSYTEPRSSASGARWYTCGHQTLLDDQAEVSGESESFSIPIADESQTQPDTLTQPFPDSDPVNLPQAAEHNRCSLFQAPVDESQTRPEPQLVPEVDNESVTEESPLLMESLGLEDLRSAILNSTHMRRAVAAVAQRWHERHSYGHGSHRDEQRASLSDSPLSVPSDFGEFDGN